MLGRVKRWVLAALRSPASGRLLTRPARGDLLNSSGRRASNPIQRLRRGSNKGHEDYLR
jgi:hypothetical protein